MKTLQAIRGMNDILPEKAPYWSAVTEACREIALQYAYREIQLPIVESTVLFERTIGEATDIVEKEMYTFEDRNGDSLSLRPEGTAGCVRAGIEHGLLYNQTQRLWYQGPMFRHERPQKGRYRQFQQFGVEAYGMAGAAIEAELILLSQRIWKRLGISDALHLEINSLSTKAIRDQYKTHLVEYFKKYKNDLSEDERSRLQRNPLRLLDSKNPALEALIAGAPSLSEHLDEESRSHFDAFQQHLQDNGVPYTVNPRLVRGLDYYSHTVFEWITRDLGAQGTLCAGGRYDGLVSQLGGQATSAVGFALGMDRTVLLLESLGAQVRHPDVYFIIMNEAEQSYALTLAEALREVLPSLSIDFNLSGGSLKRQFKRADKSGARFAVVIGEAERQANQAVLKFLREEQEQQTVTSDQLIELLKL